jgi:hypothetical protein
LEPHHGSAWSPSRPPARSGWLGCTCSAVFPRVAVRTRSFGVPELAGGMPVRSGRGSLTDSAQRTRSPRRLELVRVLLELDSLA